MNGDTRNTKVVVCLIAAMTIGMRVLMWLEPTPASSAASMPLTAVGAPIEDVTVAYAAAGDFDPSASDVLVLRDGRCDGRAAGPHVRVVVVGTPAELALATEQKKALLTVLDGMTNGRDGAAVPVRLQADSDDRQRSDLPPQARDLRELLERKGKLK